MSDNNNNSWGSSPGGPNNDWDQQLPGEGKSWGPEHEPQRPDGVPDAEWGTAPRADPYGAPRPGQQPGSWGQPQRPSESSSNQYYGAGGGPIAPHRAPEHQLARKPSAELDSNDIVALVLSVLLPGVGHMILGQTTKGLAILVMAFFTCNYGMVGLAFVLYDAYMVAIARKARPVDDWEFLPKP
ncbi:MAG: hypothetical protein AAGI01_01905 [Myxococcota bacterium]